MTKENLIGPSQHGRTYRLLESLGSGISGIVYKALREPDGQQVPFRYQNQPVAIKFYISSSIHPEVQSQREINFLGAACRSPKVVEYLDRSRPGEELQYIVMECLPETLEHRLRHHLHTLKKSVPQKLVETYLREIPAVLDALWQEQVTHLDLRAPNLGIKYDELKLFDFGLARSFGRNFSSPFSQILTLYPPELRLAGRVTSTCDTYCAGKTLQRMLLGSYRHSAEEAIDLLELMHKVTLPVSFKRLLMSMTNPNYLCRPNPTALLELCAETRYDLNKQRYFRERRLLPLGWGMAGISTPSLSSLSSSSQAVC